MRNARRLMRASALALLFTCILSGCSRPPQVTVSAETAAAALEAARSGLGVPYVYGGQSPGGFDCSGLIIWAYHQVEPAIRFYVGFGGPSDDAAISALFRWNYQPVLLGDLIPGDLVFLADETGRVTHGGLVTSVSEDTFHFINASSYYGCVVEDDWPLSGEKRGQRVAGYGRLLMCLP